MAIGIIDNISKISKKTPIMQIFYTGDKVIICLHGSTTEFVLGLKIKVEGEIISFECTDEELTQALNQITWADIDPGYDTNASDEDILKIPKQSIEDMSIDENIVRNNIRPGYLATSPNGQKENCEKIKKELEKLEVFPPNAELTTFLCVGHYYNIWAINLGWFISSALQFVIVYLWNTSGPLKGRNRIAEYPIRSYLTTNNKDELVLVTDQGNPATKIVVLETKDKPITCILPNNTDGIISSSIIDITAPQQFDRTSSNGSTRSDATNQSPRGDIDDEGNTAEDGVVIDDEGNTADY